MSGYNDPHEKAMWLLVASIVSIIVALVFASGQNWFAALLSVVIGAGCFVGMMFSGGNNNAPR